MLNNTIVVLCVCNQPLTFSWNVNISGIRSSISFISAYKIIVNFYSNRVTSTYLINKVGCLIFEIHSNTLDTLYDDGPSIFHQFKNKHSPKKINGRNSSNHLKNGPGLMDPFVLSLKCSVLEFWYCLICLCLIWFNLKPKPWMLPNLTQLYWRDCRVFPCKLFSLLSYFGTFLCNTIRIPYVSRLLSMSNLLWDLHYWFNLREISQNMECDCIWHLSYEIVHDYAKEQQGKHHYSLLLF